MKTPCYFLGREISSGEPLRVGVEISNIGKRDGADVIQLYVAHASAPGEPRKQLTAFTKAFLRAGESKRVTVTLGRAPFPCGAPEVRVGFLLPEPIPPLSATLCVIFHGAGPSGWATETPPPTLFRAPHKQAASGR